MTECQDKLGQVIKMGSLVACPTGSNNNRISLCRVEKIMPKQVKVKPIDDTWMSEYYRFQAEVICIDNIEETVMWLMTRSVKGSK